MPAGRGYPKTTGRPETLTIGVARQRGRFAGLGSEKVSVTVERDEKGRFSHGEGSIPGPGLLSVPEPVKVTPAEFTRSLAKVKLGAILEHYTAQELAGIDLYQVPGLDAGFGVKYDGEIVNVHNGSQVKGLGLTLVDEAIERGGTSLNHFDVEPLTRIYSAAGFVETERIKWDDQYAPKGWDYERFGRPDVVTRKLQR